MIEKEKLVSIVTAVQNGEQNAMAELYNASYQEIHYFIMKTVKDPELAADLTQDTFIEIINTIGSLKEPAAFVTWSRRIAYHKCTGHFRKKKDTLLTENEEGGSIFETIVEEREEFIPDAALDKEELKNAIRAIIDELPEEQRTVLILRYFDEIPVKDIAEIQGVPEGTVKSRLNYARKTVKTAVEEYEKKNGIKLHCKGVVPLLLWLFKEYKTANGIATTTNTVATSTVAASVKGLWLKIVAVITATVVVAGTVWTEKPKPVDEKYQSMNDVVSQDFEEWYNWNGFEGTEISSQMFHAIVPEEDIYGRGSVELRGINIIEDSVERKESKIRFFGLTDSDNVKWATATEPGTGSHPYVILLQAKDEAYVEDIIAQMKKNLDPKNWEYYPYDPETDSYGKKTTYWSHLSKDGFVYYVNEDYILVTYVDDEKAELENKATTKDMQNMLDSIVAYKNTLEAQEE